MSFDDTRVILCRPDDPRLAHVWDSHGGFEQACDGPTFVVIGADTSDVQCSALGARFSMSVAELVAFRDAACSSVH